MRDRGDWGWRFAPSAENDWDRLDAHIQNRIVEKLDDIVTDQWRDPTDYVEPLAGQPRDILARRKRRGFLHSRNARRGGFGTILHGPRADSSYPSEPWRSKALSPGHPSSAMSSPHGFSVRLSPPKSKRWPASGWMCTVHGTTVHIPLGHDPT